MKLSELFLQLSEGEFRQYAIGGSEASGIEARNYIKVIPQIYLGLTELHKRFSLRTAQVIIQQHEQIGTYQLHTDYARTNTASTKPVKYIMDSTDRPFDDHDSVLLIEAVYQEDGQPFPLNDDTEVFSVFTPTERSIQVPFNDSANILTVQYRQNHPKLRHEGEDILEQEVDISATYLEALLLYVAARYLINSGNADAVAEGNQLQARFELSTANVSRLNLHTNETRKNNKLDDGGWP